MDPDQQSDMEAGVAQPSPELVESLPTAVISLLVMEALAEAEEPLGVSELARRLGMPKARVHRHLSGLREHGYVTQMLKSNHYTTGWRLHLLGQQLVQKFDVIAIARPMMEDLRDLIGQTVVISTFTEDEVIVLNVISGRSALEIGLRTGTRFPLNTVAQGKIALAFGPDGLMERFLLRPLAANTGHSIIDPERLLVETELTRRRGWADAPEEIFTGINAIAAPVFRNDGTLFGALAIVGSIDFLSRSPDERTIHALISTARQISGGLGFQG